MVQEAWGFLQTRQKLNLCIVILNIAIFVVLEALGSTSDVMFMLEHGAMYAPWVEQYGEWYRLVTCMFLHFGAEHLLYNMLLLIFAGDTLEREVGKIRYLMIYLCGGVLGNLLSMEIALYTEEAAVSAGASGGIFAVIGALVVLVVSDKERRRSIGGKRLVIMALLSLAEGFTQTGTDNLAHLGGFLGGALLCVLTGVGRRHGRGGEA